MIKIIHGRCLESKGPSGDGCPRFSRRFWRRRRPLRELKARNLDGNTDRSYVCVRILTQVSGGRSDAILTGESAHGTSSVSDTSGRCMHSNQQPGITCRVLCDNSLLVAAALGAAYLPETAAWIDGNVLWRRTSNLGSHGEQDRCRVARVAAAQVRWCPRRNLEHSRGFAARGVPSLFVEGMCMQYGWLAPGFRMALGSHLPVCGDCYHDSWRRRLERDGQLDDGRAVDTDRPGLYQ